MVTPLKMDRPISTCLLPFVPTALLLPGMQAQCPEEQQPLGSRRTERRKATA